MRPGSARKGTGGRRARTRSARRHPAPRRVCRSDGEHHRRAHHGRAVPGWRSNYQYGGRPANREQDHHSAGRDGHKAGRADAGGAGAQRLCPAHARCGGTDQGGEPPHQRSGKMDGGKIIMDISVFGLGTVAAITVLCYLAGTGVKTTPLDNKYIPVICGGTGLVLGLVALYAGMPEFPAADPITAAAVGAVSGLAATGINQAVKQLGKTEEYMTKAPGSDFWPGAFFSYQFSVVLKHMYRTSFSFYILEYFF